jgi:ATP-binding cassette, subfamily B, bacterial CvaB/MchF/RaxB
MTTATPVPRKLQFWRKKTPLIMQTEAAECGLASLAMVAAHHGYITDLQSLRREHAISLKGSTLKSLIEIASAMQLAARPLRVEIAGLSRVRLPAIVHYDFNHFVVLTSVSASSVTFNDPARGVRTLTIDEFSKHFTGVVLELTPTTNFVKRSRLKCLRWQCRGSRSSRSTKC